MSPRKAAVENDQLIDEPIDLPHDAEPYAYFDDAADPPKWVYPDEILATTTQAERDALELILERGIADAKAGRSIDADEVLAELERV